MLNASGRFAVPALAPALLNLGMVVFGVGAHPGVPRAGQPAILAMAIGVLIGGALQFARAAAGARPARLPAAPGVAAPASRRAARRAR